MVMSGHQKRIQKALRTKMDMPKYRSNLNRPSLGLSIETDSDSDLDSNSDWDSGLQSNLQLDLEFGPKSRAVSKPEIGVQLNLGGTHVLRSASVPVVQTTTLLHSKHSADLRSHLETPLDGISSSDSSLDADYSVYHRQTSNIRQNRLILADSHSSDDLIDLTGEDPLKYHLASTQNGHEMGFLNNHRKISTTQPLQTTLPFLVRKVLLPRKEPVSGQSHSFRPQTKPRPRHFQSYQPSERDETEE